MSINLKKLHVLARLVGAEAAWEILENFKPDQISPIEIPDGITVTFWHESTSHQSITSGEKKLPPEEADLVVEEINNIFVELAQIDRRIAQTQAGIDDLKMETREILATLPEIIVQCGKN